MQNFFQQFPNPHQISLDLNTNLRSLPQLAFFGVSNRISFKLSNYQRKKKKKMARYLSIYYRIMNYLQEGPVQCTSPNFN